MVTFKGEWGKLYYTQHTLLSNVGQLPILFFEKQTHTQEQDRIEEKGMPNFFMFRILIVWESLFLLVYWACKNKLQIHREVRLDQFYAIL